MPGLNIGPREVPAPLPGGLFSVLTPEDAGDRIIGGITADPMVCGEVSSAEGWCFPTASVDPDFEPVEKEPVGFSDFTEQEGNGAGFYTYLALECYLDGGALAADAERAYLAGEEQAVGLRLVTLLDALSGGPTTATDLTDALGTAENSLRSMAFPGYIFASPRTLIRLGSHVRHTDGALHTRLGSPLVAVVGAPDDTLYVSGQVTLYRGNLATHEVASPKTNRRYVVSERPWAALIDCEAETIEVVTEP